MVAAVANNSEYFILTMFPMAVKMENRKSEVQAYLCTNLDGGHDRQSASPRGEDMGVRSIPCLHADSSCFVFLQR